MFSPAGTCIRHPHVLTCWYHALAVVGPAPHTSVNNLSTRTCSLDWNSFNLRSSPLWAISQILSASLAPTPCRDRASWGRNSMQCNVCTANHYTDTDRQTDSGMQCLYSQPQHWHRQTDRGMQCLYSQPLHWHRQTERLTVAWNVYTANHYTDTDRQTDSSMQCLYSQPLHSHRHTHRLTVACNVNTANHTLTQTDRLTVACNDYTANHYTHTDRHTDWQ